MSEKRYNVIYADPPWHYDDMKGRRPEWGGVTYPTMTVAEIAALPVKALAADDCALFLWVTMPKLEEIFSHDLFGKWGFSFRTCAFVWVKQNPSHDRQHPQLFYPTDKEALNIYAGMGNWTQGNAELCLFGRRGRPQRLSKSVKQVVISPRERHSKKPDEVRRRIVQLMGDVPRVELFAREKVDGWDVWGNEVQCDVQLPDPKTVSHEAVA